MKHHISGIPVSWFSIVLGLLGLGNDWRAATRLWSLPGFIGETIVTIGLVVWAWLLLGYCAKWMRRRTDAVAELNNPVTCCFIGLVPLSTILAGLAVLPYAPAPAAGICLVGALGTATFALWRQGGLWLGENGNATITPVLYLPTGAGSFVVAIAAGAFGWQQWAEFFFGTGILTWLALESVILYRLLTAGPLAAVQRPTLGIQLAPPVVGLLAYLATGATPGLVAHMLLGYGVMQALILLRLLPWIRQQPFNSGYWAFTFGATALALGAMKLAETGGTGPERVLAPILFVVVNLVVGSIAIGSVMQVLRFDTRPVGREAAR